MYHGYRGFFWTGDSVSYALCATGALCLFLVLNRRFMAFDPMKKGCKSLSLTTVEAGYVSCGLYFQFTATIFSISEFIFLLALSPPGFG